MRFNGLPGNMWQKDLDVQPLGVVCPLLQSCDFCEYFNPNYYLCGNGHVTCLECEKRNITFNEQTFCKECSAYSYRITVPMQLVLTIDFYCGCGYLGTLAEIQTHAKSADFNVECEVLRKTSVSEFRDSIAELKDLKEIFASIRKDLRARLDRIRGILEHFGLELLSRHKFQEGQNRVERLKARTNELCERYLEIKGVNDQVRPLVELLFEKTTWCMFSVDQLLAETSIEKFVSVAGVFLAIRIVVNAHGLGDVYVHMGAAEPGQTTKKRTVVLRWHNSVGYTMKETALKTNDEGLFDTNDSGDATVRLHNLQNHKKVPGFIDTMRIIGPSSLLNDWLYLSAQLYDK